MRAPVRGGWPVTCLLSAAAVFVAVRSSRPGSSPSPPALAFDPGAIDLGVLPAGRETAVEVPWRRLGSGDLRVIAVKTGCGCAEAEGVPGLVPESASGSLRVRLAGRTELGPFSVSVRAYSDAPPPGDVAVVRLRGYVGDLAIARPPVLDLGPRGPASAAARRVEVCIPPGASGGVEASLEGLPGEALVVAPLRADRNGGDVLVSVVVPEVAGPFAGLLRVRAGAGEPWAIPIRGVVVAGTREDAPAFGR